MSKITNDDLTRSGTGCLLYSCTSHMTTVGVKGLTYQHDEKQEGCLVLRKVDYSVASWLLAIL